MTHAVKTYPNYWLKLCSIFRASAESALFQFDVEDVEVWWSVALAYTRDTRSHFVKKRREAVRAVYILEMLLLFQPGTARAAFPSLARSTSRGSVRML
jgi:hypothetical protein